MSLKHSHVAFFTGALFVVMAACSEGNDASNSYFSDEWSGASGSGNGGTSGNGGSGSTSSTGCKRLAECCARIATDEKSACTLIVSQNNGTASGNDTCDLLIPSYASLCDMPTGEGGSGGSAAAGNGGAAGDNLSGSGGSSGLSGSAGASGSGGASSGGSGGSAGGPFGGNGGSAGAPFGGSGGSAGSALPFGGSAGSGEGEIFGGNGGSSAGDTGSGGGGTGEPCASDKDCPTDGCCTANLICGVMDPFLSMCL